MATCDITAGRLRACKENLGGMETVYLFNYVTQPFTVANGAATAINPLITAVYQYEIDGDTHGLVQDFVSSKDTGVSVNTQTLTVMLKKMDAITSAQINILVYGKTGAVIKDRNGVYHAMGVDDGVDFNVNSTTGLAKTDMNGYTLTGTCQTKALAPILDSATVTAFLALLPSEEEEE
jgi:hypothetical protein